MIGTVIRLFPDKGFGFVKDDEGVEYFFHRSAVEQPLTFDEIQPQDRVQFEGFEGPKGFRAEQVTTAE